MNVVETVLAYTVLFHGRFFELREFTDGSIQMVRLSDDVVVKVWP